MGFSAAILKGSRDLVSKVLRTLSRVITRNYIYIYICRATSFLTLVDKSHEPASTGCSLLGDFSLELGLRLLWQGVKGAFITCSLHRSLELRTAPCRIHVRCHGLQGCGTIEVFKKWNRASGHITLRNNKSYYTMTSSRNGKEP